MAVPGRANFRAKLIAKRQAKLARRVNPVPPAGTGQKSTRASTDLKPNLRHKLLEAKASLYQSVPSPRSNTSAPASPPKSYKPKAFRVVAKVQPSRPTPARKRKFAPLLHVDHRGFGTIDELRDLLGLPTICTGTIAPFQQQDALLISLDTEFDRHGLINHVSEIGLTVLDTRDIRSIPPGLHARDWFAKAKTYHYIVAGPGSHTSHQRSCLFAPSFASTASVVHAQLQQLLHHITSCTIDPLPYSHRSDRQVILIGHSLASDTAVLRQDPSFHFDLLDPAAAGFHLAQTYDTNILALAARQQGAGIPSARLGPLVRWLGVHARFRAATGRRRGVLGWHNAGNDAAYTMMALLMLAVDWPSIVRRGKHGAPRSLEGKRSLYRFFLRLWGWLRVRLRGSA